MHMCGGRRAVRTEGDVLEVALDLRERDLRDRTRGSASDGDDDAEGETHPEGVLRDVAEVVVRRELPVVARLDLEDVGEKVGRLEGEVLDDEVDLLRRVLRPVRLNVSNVDRLEKEGRGKGGEGRGRDERRRLKHTWESARSQSAGTEPGGFPCECRPRDAACT